MEGSFSQTSETTQEEGSGCVQIIFTDSETETTCKMGREAHSVFIFAVTTWQDQGCFQRYFFYSGTQFPGKLFLGKEMTAKKKEKKKETS